MCVHEGEEGIAGFLEMVYLMGVGDKPRFMWRRRDIDALIEQGTEHLRVELTIDLQSILKVIHLPFSME